MREVVGFKPTDGVFWISFSDMLKYFSAIEVCKLHDDWHDTRLSSFFGATPHAIRPAFSMFLISANRPTWLLLQLIQEDERGASGEDIDYHYADMALFIAQAKYATGAKPEENCDDGIPLFSDELILQPKNHKFNSCTFPTISRNVHCETFLTETSDAYIAMPITFNAKRSKKFVFSCYSANPVLIRELNFNDSILASVAQQAIKSKDDFKVFEEHCFFYSGTHNDSIWFFVVNSHPTQTFEISLTINKSVNLLPSRGSMVTMDHIPPLHQQILNVLSITLGSNGFSYALKYSYQYHEGEPELQIHVPGISKFHEPTPITH